MPSLCWRRWWHHNNYQGSRGNNNTHHIKGYSHKCSCVCSPNNIQVDIYRCPGSAKIRLGLSQGLLNHFLQWPTSCLCHNPRHRNILRLHGLRSLQRLVQHGFRQPKRYELRHGSTNSLLLRTQEHLGSRISMGSHHVLLQDLYQPLECQWMGSSTTTLLWHDLWLLHRCNRPNSHRRQHEHVPLLCRRQWQDLPRQHAHRKLPWQLRYRINSGHERHHQQPLRSRASLHPARPE